MSSDKKCSNCSNINHASENLCNVSSFQQAEEVSNDTYTFQNVNPIPTSGESWTCSFENLQSKDVASKTQGSENLSSDNKDDNQTDEIKEADQNHSIQRDDIVNEDNHKIDAEKDQERNEIQKETKEPEDNICCSSSEECDESFEDIPKNDTDTWAQSKNGSIIINMNEHEEPEKEKRQSGFHNQMRELRLVMIGPTGSGKSKTGNTILGKDKFVSKMKAVSVTSKCQFETDVRFNREVVIVDTPGVFDTHRNNEEIAKEIMKCIAMTTPGPHAFLLVLNPTVRFSMENKQSVEFFVKHFKKNLFDYLIVVFTRKDELEQEHMTIEEYLKDIPEELESVLQKCGNKYFAINNRANDKEKEAQIIKLFQMIDQMIENNDGGHYTNEFYEMNEKLFQKQMDKNRKKVDENLKREQEEIYKNKCKMEDQKFEELKNEEEKKRGRPLHDDEINEIKRLACEDTKSSVTHQIITLAKKTEEKKKDGALRNQTRDQINNEDPEVTVWLSEGTKTLIKISLVSVVAVGALSAASYTGMINPVSAALLVATDLQRKFGK